MRLLLSINSLGAGGAERTVVKLAAHWLAQGHAVGVVTQASRSLDVLTLPVGVSRFTTDTGGISGHWLRAVVRNLRRVQRLRRVIRDFRPDGVVAFLPTANVVAVLACVGLSVPVIAAERMYPAHLGLGWLQRSVRDRAYARAAAVVVQTTRSAEWYRRTCLLSNVVVIPNGIALPLVVAEPAVEPSALIPGDRRLVLYVGRLVPEKQVDQALLAFVRALGNDERWTLAVLGDGPLVTGLRDMAGKALPPGRVVFVPRSGCMAAWYQRADVLLLTSRFEGFPNVLLEAMAHGCVPVAYDCDTGPAEIVRDGEDGELVPPNDVEALAGSLRRLSADADRLARMAAAATQVLERFGDARFFAAWDAVVLSASAGVGQGRDA
ncbi:MAG: glycosyltransferase [Pseudomonadales bacterium]|nr:glycosyltransferase [Pseudomonadales bacterium]